MAADEFEWYRAAVAGRDAPPINANEPQSGYFKMRDGRDGPWLPVAIWRKDGALVCRVGSTWRDPVDVWSWAAKNPVAKEAAKHAFETGSWPGDVAIGHNSGTITLADEIKDAVSQALDWLRGTTISDKVSADMAGNYRAKLLELAKTADAERDAKVRPHLDAQRTINAEYKPLVDSAKVAADTLRAALGKYLAAADDKARKAAAEAARIENERRLAEFEKQKAAATVEAPPPMLPMLVAPEPVKVQAGGQRGKKVGLRAVTRYEITDYPVTLKHVADHPDVRAAVEKIAFAQARAGATVPGVRSFEEKVAV